METNTKRYNDEKYKSGNGEKVEKSEVDIKNELRNFIIPLNSTCERKWSVCISKIMRVLQANCYFCWQYCPVTPVRGQSLQA